MLAWALGLDAKMQKEEVEAKLKQMETGAAIIAALNRPFKAATPKPLDWRKRRLGMPDLPHRTLGHKRSKVAESPLSPTSHPPGLQQQQQQQPVDIDQLGQTSLPGMPAAGDALQGGSMHHTEQQQQQQASAAPRSGAAPQSTPKQDRAGQHQLAAEQQTAEQQPGHQQPVAPQPGEQQQQQQSGTAASRGDAQQQSQPPAAMKGSVQLHDNASSGTEQHGAAAVASESEGDKALRRAVDLIVHEKLQPLEAQLAKARREASEALAQQQCSQQELVAARAELDQREQQQSRKAAADKQAFLADLERKFAAMLPAALPADVRVPIKSLLTVLHAAGMLLLQ